VADYTLGSVGLRLLPKLARRQVHVSLHDHPLESARRAGFCRYDLREIAAFQSGLAALHPTVDAVSEELLKAIMPDVKRTSIIALPAMSCATAPAVVGPTTEGPLRFGLSGNFFGQEELNCFLHGLEQWSSRTGRDWRLLVFGRKPEGKLDQRIDFRGFRPIEEARDQLARCDVLLLPLPVDADSIQMRTSVPTKLTTYLEVGRLVFAFAPSGSATERIIAQSALGPVVTRLDPSVVAGQLNQLATWNLAAANVGRQRLLEHRYNEHRMLSDLNCLLSP
jgi:hypothetical protein